MIEKIVLDHLNKSLSVKAYTEVPEEAPTEYVIIEKVGCDENNFLYQTALAIRPIAKSLARAALIDEEVKNAMPKIAEHRQITRCKLSSGYNYTNTVTKEYRYQSIYELVHY